MKMHHSTYRAKVQARFQAKPPFGEPIDEWGDCTHDEIPPLGFASDLATRYKSKAFTMIYSMVQNEQDAWDLAQEGFLAAWCSIRQFKGQSSFYTWLYRIMTNVTIQGLRRKGVHGQVEFDELGHQHCARR
jgi:hypothetical protein